MSKLNNITYKLLTDYNNEHKNMHRNDNHHIQKNVTSGEGKKRMGLGERQRKLQMSLSISIINEK